MFLQGPERRRSIDMTTRTLTPPAAEPISSTRARILEAAYALLQAAGPDAITTRAVATAAKVQVPTIYRAFGDKQGRSASALSGFDMPPVLLSGQTTRRLGRSIHSYSSSSTSDMRAANSNCSRIARVRTGCSSPSASALSR